MYLMIFEDGQIGKMDQVSDGDMSAADDGCCDLLDISDPQKPKRYDAGEWNEILPFDA